MQTELRSAEAERDSGLGEFDERNERDQSRWRIELYAMPDDRWQQNEISARAPAIVDAMISVLIAWMQTDVHSRDRLAELLWSVDEALLTPIR